MSTTASNESSEEPVDSRSRGWRALIVDHPIKAYLTTLAAVFTTGVGGTWLLANSIHEEREKSWQAERAELDALKAERAAARQAPGCSSSNEETGAGSLASRIGSATRPPQYLAGVAPDMIPEQWEEISSNAQLTLYGADETGIPPAPTWYQRELDGSLRAHAAPRAAPRALSHVLFYKSTLFTKTNSWSGFFFWWRKVPKRLTERGASSFALLVRADSADTLELGFKDAAHYEVKVGLAVKPGWNGYIIPFQTFAVDFNRIELAIVAHSRGQRCGDENTFRFAFIGPI